VESRVYTVQHGTVLISTSLQRFTHPRLLPPHCHTTRRLPDSTHIVGGLQPPPPPVLPALAQLPLPQRSTSTTTPIFTQPPPNHHHNSLSSHRSRSHSHSRSHSPCATTTRIAAAATAAVATEAQLRSQPLARLDRPSQGPSRASEMLLRGDVAAMARSPPRLPAPSQ